MGFLMAKNREGKLRFPRDPENHLKIVQHRARGNSPLVNGIVNQPPSREDPMGMYTGNPLDENEVPVQDADDL